MREALLGAHSRDTLEGVFSDIPVFSMASDGRRSHVHGDAGSGKPGGANPDLWLVNNDLDYHEEQRLTKAETAAPVGAAPHRAARRTRRKAAV